MLGPHHLFLIVCCNVQSCHFFQFLVYIGVLLLEIYCETKCKHLFATWLAKGNNLKAMSEPFFLFFCSSDRQSHKRNYPIYIFKNPITIGKDECLNCSHNCRAIFKRPGVAWAGLQTASSLTD